MLLPLYLILAIQTPTLETLDRASLAHVMETIWAPIEDFSCEFEGVKKFPREEERRKRGVDATGTYDNFTGKFLYNGSGKVILEVHHIYKPSNKQFIQTALLRDGMVTQYDRSIDSVGGVETRSPSPSVFDQQESPGLIFPIHMVTEILKDPRMEVRHEGEENVGGHRCQVVAIHYHGELREKTGETLSQRWWIDLNRGGNLLKRETFGAYGQLSKRVYDVELRQFSSADGQSVWIPISGKCDTYHYEYDEDSRPTTRGFVINHAVLYILGSTVRINTGLSDSQFALDLKKGTPIHDRLKGIRRVEGEDMRPAPVSVAEAEQRLKEYLREAEDMGNELKASSWQRGGGRHWAVWVPWAIMVGSLSAIVTVLIMRARSS